MTTLISHIYNEEYLLPFFIEHHYEKFENGIILDYGSTDASLNILEKLAPRWKIVDCSGENFDALKLDELVHSIEEKLIGICLVLTVTEFFVGDPRFITKGMVLPSYSLLRSEEDPEIEAGQKFHEVYKIGVSPFQSRSFTNSNLPIRKMGRTIRTTREKYPVGRHFDVLGHTPFLIYRVANCLANEDMIIRRLQIQERIPLSDIELGYGVQHTNYGKKLDIETLHKSIESELLISEDVSGSIYRALELERYLERLETGSKNFKMMKLIMEQFELNQKMIEDLVVRKSNSASELVLNRDDLEENYNRLIKKIQYLETQSKRPSYNFSLLLASIFPAIKMRFRGIVK
jgi:hypothetical protein